MNDTKIKTLSIRTPTNYKGVYYKEIEKTTIDNHGNIKTKIIDKVFIIRYRDNDKERLITIGKYSEGIREAYCKAKRDEFLTLAKNGELPPQIEKRKKRDITTLDDLAKVYFEDKESENKTNMRQLQKYNLYFGTIEPISINIEYASIRVNSNESGLGKEDINSITKEDITKLQKLLKADGKAPKTINGVIQLLTAIINHSIKEKSLQLNNPCSGVKRLKTDDKRERYLSLNEVKQLIDDVRDNEAVYHFVKLALTTGARLQGVLSIQKKDINLNGNSITLKDLKSGGTYTGFYDDEYKAELEEYTKHLRANDYVVGANIEQLPSRSLSRWLKPILDKLFNDGLKIDDRKNRVVIHTLRHTFASQLAIAGVPILTIKNLMNHADIAQTMRYAKLAPNQGIEAVKGLYKN